MPGGKGGMQRALGARVSDGNRDARGKAERRAVVVGIARMGVCSGEASGGGGRRCSWRCEQAGLRGLRLGQATGLRGWTWAY